MKKINSIIIHISRQRINAPFWLALLFVIFFSAFAIHGDFFWLTALASRTASGNFNLYQNLFINNQDTGKFLMPPLIGIVDAFLYFITKIIGLAHFNYGLNDHIPFINLLMLKSRYILIFVLSYPLINKVAIFYTKDKNLSKKIANIWISSPLLIYLPFAQGNNDIYPTVLSIVFLYFAFRKKYFWAMLTLGLTAALKNYAFFLFIPAALIFSKKDLKRTFLFLLTALLASFLPSILYFGNLQGLSNYSTANKENLIMLGTTITSSQANYSIFVIVYVITILFLYFDNNLEEIRDNENKLLVTYCFLSLLPFFIAFFLPQWFLWILPFFVFLVFDNYKLYKIYLLTSFVYLFSLIINWSKNLDLTLFKQIRPELANGGVHVIGAGDITAIGIVSSIFVGSLITFIVFLFRNAKSNNRLVPDRSVFLNFLPTVSYIVLLFFLAVISFNRS